MIDFTNCKRVLSKAYSGANGKKIAVEYEGEQYMLKFPPSGKERKTELSYINSCYSEHLGSSIFNMLGINAQKTMLGTYHPIPVPGIRTQRALWLKLVSDRMRTPHSKRQ